MGISNRALSRFWGEQKGTSGQERIRGSGRSVKTFLYGRVRAETERVCVNSDEIPVENQFV